MRPHVRRKGPQPMTKTALKHKIPDSPVAGGGGDAHRQSQTVAGHVKLGRQAALGTTEATGIRPPFCAARWRPGHAP